MSTCKLSSLLFLLVCLFVLQFLQICMLLIRQQFPSPPSPQKKILYATLTSTDSMIAIHVHYIKIQPCTHAFGRTSEGRERLVHLFAHAENLGKKDISVILRITLTQILIWLSRSRSTCINVCTSTVSMAWSAFERSHSRDARQVGFKHC